MLTDPDCRNATCPEGSSKLRLTDGGGLFLEITPNGSKRWFWRYAVDGKVRALPLGSYCRPGDKKVLVSLKAARLARDAARAEKDSGVDPLFKRKAEKLVGSATDADSFEAVAREFHASKTGALSPLYSARWIERMEKDLFPWIGSMRLADITAPLLLQTLRRVEARGAKETAHTLRQTAGQVFRYGVATGRCERNPAPDLHGALKPLVVKHMSAILEPARVGELMRSIATYEGQPTTRAALALSALLFQRPGNIRAMEWAHVDLETAMWTIPAASMKRTVHGKTNGRPHLVPLAPQAVAILRELHPLTGHGRLVFPGLHNHERPMSENTVNLALRRMGYSGDEMMAHGFRSVARTLMVERLPGIAPDVIEAQLAHGKSGPLGMAYDRAEFMEQRRQMMVTWADYLDRLREGAQVIAFKAA